MRVTLNLVTLTILCCFMLPQFHAAPSLEMCQFLENIANAPIEALPIENFMDKMRTFNVQDFQKQAGPCMKRQKRDAEKVDSLKNQSFLISILKFLER